MSTLGRVFILASCLAASLMLPMEVRIGVVIAVAASIALLGPSAEYS